MKILDSREVEYAYVFQVTFLPNTKKEVPQPNDENGDLAEPLVTYYHSCNIIFELKDSNGVKIDKVRKFYQMDEIDDQESVAVYMPKITEAIKGWIAEGKKKLSGYEG